MNIGKKGSVLYFAMMILLVLGAISVVAVHSVSNAIFRTGSYKVGKLASNLTEGGVEGSLAYAVFLGPQFNSIINPGTNTGSFTEDNIVPNFYDESTGGSFGKEIANISVVRFVSNVQLTAQTNRIPGFDIGEYCFNKYSMFTTGTYGMGNIVNPDDVLHNAQKVYMSVLYVEAPSCGGGE